MRDGPNSRQTQDRGTATSVIDNAQRGVSNFMRGLHEDGSDGPAGTAVSIRREVEIPIPRGLSLAYLSIRPIFRGQVAVQFGSSNPEIELIRQSGRFEVEFNQQLSESLTRTTTIEIQDEQLTILGNAIRQMTSSPAQAMASTLRTALATQIVRTYQVNNWSVEALMPPEVSFNRLRATVTVAFMYLVGTWAEKVYETTLWGIPARIILTGEIAFRVGLKALGWQWIGRIIASQVGPLTAAQEMQILTAQLSIRGFANGLLGIYSPGIVAFGTPVVTFLIDYAWAHLIQHVRQEGERRGLLNQFATGYIHRIFYPTQPNLWYSNHPTGRQREARRHGIDVASRDCRRRPADILQQLLYAELDYHGHERAEVSDIVYRLGEALFRGQRNTSSPGPRQTVQGA